MPTYRVFFLDSENHIAAPVSNFDALDDGDALERANQLVDGHAVELWEGERRIAVLKPPASGGENEPSQSGDQQGQPQEDHEGEHGRAPGS